MKKRMSLYNFNIYNNHIKGLISLRILVLLTLFVLLFLPLFSAAENDTNQTQVNKAYACLQDKVSGKCADLSVEEKTFSLLSINQCRTELLADSSNSGECWPSSNCMVKETAQATLALGKRGGSTTAAQAWLLSKNVTPSELSWYLEIESPEPTTCTITYDSSSYTVSIDAEKKIDTGAGNCLSLAQENYWLRVSPACYNTEFRVSCDENFLTTTLFRKSTSSTIHVSEKTSSAAAGGTTSEKVESYCFADAGSCNYESTLWASLALSSLGKSVSSYLPYLITLADDNQRYLPDSFLYALTAKAEFKNSLLSSQKSNSWWMESGDKFYDTALALYPLPKDTSTEKANAKKWLLSSQDTNGCWENNLRNTAFILASVWPKTFAGTGTGGTTLPDCEDSNYYCTSSAVACTTAGGEQLSEFDCPGTLQKCCTVQEKIETCAEQGGEICSSNERCIGGVEPGASDLRSTEICCAGDGYCSATTGGTGEENECEINNGICRAGGCGIDEEETFYSCDSSSSVCCVSQPSTDGKSYWWIWVLLVLIVLVAIGIIFRNRLRIFWFKMRGGGSSRPSGPPSHMPSHFPQYIQRPIQRIERRIMVPQHHAPQRPAPLTRMKSGAQRELDEVLKKLKDMSK